MILLKEQEVKVYSLESEPSGKVYSKNLIYSCIQHLS